MIKPDYNKPSFLYDDLELEWQMTRYEKYAFHSLISISNKKVAIEVGTFKGGSLQVLANNFDKVYSLDISKEPYEKLSPKFKNVEFLIGDSKKLLPELIQKLMKDNEDVGFILIDGDHSSEGVKEDINSVLAYKPNNDLYIVCHDSFNPDCRRGMIMADWQKCKHVHYLEIDFIPGIFIGENDANAPAKSMWGGFAVAQLKKDRRKQDLIINQSQKDLFEVVFKKSMHKNSHVNSSFDNSYNKIKGKLKSILAK